MIFETVLLFALPASGKSEVRKFLREDVSQEELARDFHLGPTTQIDDFPYVNLMRRIDEERLKLGFQPVFFQAPDKQFFDPLEWGTLIWLVNYDYLDLVAGKIFTVESAAEHLLARLRMASKAVGLDNPTGDMEQATIVALLTGIEPDARAIVDARNAANKEGVVGKTVVIEFARGGPNGAMMPFPPPLGYKYALSQLAPEITANAVVLYVRVEPWQSWTRNFERAKPGKEGDDLAHCVPPIVMNGDYGCDDLKVSGCVCTLLDGQWVELDTPSGTRFIPFAVFDNRQDLTTQIRVLPARLRHPDAMAALRSGLKDAFGKLWSQHQDCSPR